jgi:hypothetical protein
MSTSPFLGSNQVGSFPSSGVRPKQIKTKVFLSSTFWTVPPNVYTISMKMCGGGGGGAGGSTYSAGIAGQYGYGVSGGGGGGAAAGIIENLSVTPGSTFLITVGAGGNGGAGQTGNSGTGANGSTGGTTIVLGDTYGFFVSGGRGGGLNLGYGQGQATTYVSASSSIGFRYINGGAGGTGYANSETDSARTVGTVGSNAPNVEFVLGGAPGAARSGTGRGYGASGGGGGSSAFARGGTGGLGGENNLGTNVSNGTVGSNPTASFIGYTGYGGGGGGGGGGITYDDGVTLFVSSGGNGGVGGSGFVQILWEE